jgi:hypothetical protein
LILLLFCQLVQSMGFNGLFDLPQLFFILLVLGAYAFRKRYYSLYGFSCLGLACYIHMALTVKVLYAIIIRIEFVTILMTEHEETSGYVRALNIIFGDHFRDADEEADDFQARQFAYYTSLFMCIYFCQVWKQAKLNDIKERTNCLGEDVDFLTRAVHYYRYKDILLTENDKIDNIRR